MMSENSPAKCRQMYECQSQECKDTLCEELGRMVGSFHYLQKSDMPILHDYLTVRHIEKDEILWQEGDHCGYVAFVVKGQLKIKKGTEFQGRDVIVGIYGSGAVVGELCALDHGPRYITAVALEDTEMIVMATRDFKKLLEEHPHTGNRLLQGMLFSVSARLRKSMDRLTSMF